jgi:hypothetical protein
MLERNCERCVAAGLLELLERVSHFVALDNLSLKMNAVLLHFPIE